jgi:hypothetical protein
MAVTLTAAVIGFPDPGGSAAWERFDIVGLDHIVRVEQLPKATSKPTGNGAEST